MLLFTTVALAVKPASVVDSIVALDFPHLRGLQAGAFDGTSLTFEKGRKMVKNTDYDAELAAYEAEKARRAAEDADGQRRKRSYLAPPPLEKTTWAKHGVALSIRFEPRPDPLTVRAAVGMLHPGYEAIQLSRFPGEDEAIVGDWLVTLRLEGDQIEPLRTAIYDVLLHAAR